ncbi:MAG: UPF0164 family protein [Spirochaetales bacterium]|uniref:UPF0164 family protein n=1 Tax=Candidatus Thalassospirochaeta sargassi TaxID=3119039 RepID=A0AAJ1MMM6_9SPIO|nr:UPF0164 family protein [Spirochaetales bacterium]
MRRKFLFALLLILTATGLFASDYSDYYGSITDSDFFTGDINTGTTVFQLLRIPAGGIAEAMGTAQTAVAADTSSIMYNPAVTSLLDLTELTFGHNNWISDSSIESVNFTTRFDDLGISAGFKMLYLPFTGRDDWGESYVRGYPLEAVLSMNAAYNFFRNYYFNGISAGLSLKTGYRYISDDFYEDQSSFAVMGDFGLYTSFNFLKFYDSRDKNFSLGTVFRNAGIETLGEALPTEFAAGFAYSPIHPLNLAFDFVLPVNLLGEESEEWYMAGGFNAIMTDFFSIQGGFNWRGSNPRLSLGTTIDLAEVAFNINYMQDLATSTDALDRFSIEARIKLGDEGRYERQHMVDELYIAGLGAYANGDLQKAIAYWEAALELDNSFTPAEEFIASAARSIDLLNRMEELNRVE